MSAMMRQEWRKQAVAVKLKADAPAVSTLDELLKHEVAEQTGADHPQIRCKQWDTRHLIGRTGAAAQCPCSTNRQL